MNYPRSKHEPLKRETSRCTELRSSRGHRAPLASAFPLPQRPYHPQGGRKTIQTSSAMTWTHTSRPRGRESIPAARRRPDPHNSKMSGWPKNSRLGHRTPPGRHRDTTGTPPGRTPPGQDRSSVQRLVSRLSGSCLLRG